MAPQSPDIRYSNTNIDLCQPLPGRHYPSGAPNPAGRGVTSLTPELVFMNSDLNDDSKFFFMNLLFLTSSTLDMKHSRVLLVTTCDKLEIFFGI